MICEAIIKKEQMRRHLSYFLGTKHRAVVFIWRGGVPGLRLLGRLVLR